MSFIQYQPSGEAEDGMAVIYSKKEQKFLKITPTLYLYNFAYPPILSYNLLESGRVITA